MYPNFTDPIFSTQYLIQVEVERTAEVHDDARVARVEAGKLRGGG